MLILYFVVNVVKNNNNRLVKTCVNYVIYAPKIENNTIKIGHFIHMCHFSTFIILDGCRRRIIRNSIKVIISLNLSTSNKKILRKFNNKK